MAGNDRSQLTAVRRYWEANAGFFDWYVRYRQIDAEAFTWHLHEFDNHKQGGCSTSAAASGGCAGSLLGAAPSSRVSISRGAAWS
jgi:hypothetical protein